MLFVFLFYYLSSVFIISLFMNLNLSFLLIFSLDCVSCLLVFYLPDFLFPYMLFLFSYLPLFLIISLFVYLNVYFFLIFSLDCFSCLSILSFGAFLFPYMLFVFLCSCLSLFPLFSDSFSVSQFYFQLLFLLKLVFLSFYFLSSGLSVSLYTFCLSSSLSL